MKSKPQNRIGVPIVGEPLWDTPEAAKRTRLKERWYEEGRRKGTGPPFIQCGKFVRYSPSALYAWLAENVHVRTVYKRKRAA